ncbi:MAG: hemolysin family protein [bacterium]|nr:hemolysin family protein [bacterium]
MDDLGSIFSNLLIVAILLFINGFFVAAEISIIGARKTRIKQLTDEGNFNAKLALEQLQDIDKFIAAVQLGITMASIALGWVGESTIARMIEPCFDFLSHNSQLVVTHSISTTVAYVLITIMHVVLGEIIPKSITLQFPEKMSLMVALPMKILLVIFNPAVILLNTLANTILKLLHIPVSQSAHLAHSIEELNMLINASYKDGVLNETEKDMLQNVFKFSDLTAKQVMISRTDAVCIPVDISYDELIKITTEVQYTRYPVYDEDLDHIVGIIHAKDLFAVSTTEHKAFSVNKILRPAILVPETITMDNLVLEFKKRKGQMAIVVDEFGGTSGIVTLEDVMEEIFGEVQDEFDEEEADIKQVGENTYLVNAILRMDELGEFFEQDLIEDEDVDTIGGLVVKYLGRLAVVGDVVQIQNMECHVKEIDGARITKILIIRKPEVETGKEKFEESF